MIYKTLIEQIADGKSAFVDTGDTFEAVTTDDILAEINRRQQETGRCHSAQLVNEQPAQ